MHRKKPNSPSLFQYFLYYQHKLRKLQQLIILTPRCAYVVRQVLNLIDRQETYYGNLRVVVVLVFVFSCGRKRHDLYGQRCVPELRR